MLEKVITDNAGEKITVKWDGERFSIAHWYRCDQTTSLPRVLILNPKEMLELARFYVSTQGGK